MTIIEIVSDIFFHSLIIISVYERLKSLFKVIREQKDKNNFKKIIGEVFILFLVIIIAIFLYKYLIYK